MSLTPHTVQTLTTALCSQDAAKDINNNTGASTLTYTHHMAIGANALLDTFSPYTTVLTPCVLTIGETFTTGGDFPSGLAVNAQLNLAQDESLATTQGISVNVVTQAGNSKGISFTSGGLYGVSILVANQGTGAIDTLAGVTTLVQNVVSGTVQSVYGVLVETNTKGSGTVVSNYGVFIQDQSGGGTSAWNLYSDGSGSKNYMAGSLGLGVSAPNSVAQLQGDSTTKGWLPPRMTTTQRDAISSPPEGLTIYNTSTHTLNVYNGTAWKAVTIT